MPRYFTRSKRRRDDLYDNDFEVEQRHQKIARAFFASIQPDDNLIYSPEYAFAVDVIAGISLPKTFSEAINDPKYSQEWQSAMSEEITGLTGNGTWKEVVPPKGANMVSTKWVYTVKLKPDGSIERFKARLVARGFSQVQGIDYTETFAPTVTYGYFTFIPS